MGKLMGREEPRIFTPPLRELTPEWSLGFEMVMFVEQVLEIPMMPWQKWLAIHALELIVDDAGRRVPRFQVVTVEVARQQGKTEFSKMLALYYLYMLDAKWVVGTAQDVSIAKKIWAEVCGVVNGVDDLRGELAKRPREANGQIELLLTGDRHYVVKPSTAGGARGISADLVLMDELRMHRSFEGYGALQATTMARPAAQVWAFSNAGDSRSVVLRYLRLKAHQELGDPDGICKDVDLAQLRDDDDDEPDFGTSGWFEWSAPPDAKPMDRDAWPYMAPSLGYGFVTERSLRGKLTSAPYEVVRMEYMCQWIDGAAGGPFVPGSWEAQTIEDEPFVGPVDGCVHFSYDLSRAYVAAAGAVADGRVVVKVMKSGLRTEWVRGWLDENANRFRRITGQGKGAWVSPFLAELIADPAWRVPVELLQGPDLTDSHRIAFEALRDGQVWHVAQPALDLAASAAVKKPLGGGWVLDGKDSPCDSAPLSAWIGALWLHLRPVKEPPPPPPAARVVRSEYRGESGRSDYTSGGLSGADLATVNF